MTDTTVDRLLRAPYLSPQPGDSKPLTVLFSLLSRSDDTPLSERSRAVGHVLDNQGATIDDPAADASANALESNPNLNFEHWGEYWRKVHGPRFVHTEETDDQSLERLLRYDQLHRFAPGPAHLSAPPYRIPVDAHGKLWPTVIGHIPVYRRPHWDGVAYLNFADPEDMGIVFANDRVREKILPEDRAIFRDIAPILTRQFIVIPSQRSNESVTLVKLHVRRKGFSRAAFQSWWLHEHAPVVKELAGGFIKRYAQLHSISPIEPGSPMYHPKASNIDGVTIMNFTSVNDLEDFLRSDAHKVIASHEERLIDVNEGEWWTAISLGIVNRIAQEQVSEAIEPFWPIEV